MRLPEVHVFQDAEGRVQRVEFRDGPQRIEVACQRLVRRDDADERLQRLEITLIGKAIYHTEARA